MAMAFDPCSVGHRHSGCLAITVTTIGHSDNCEIAAADRGDSRSLSAQICSAVDQRELELARAVKQACAARTQAPLVVDD